jgi:nucleotide-binding universal stress UspA family protein
MIKDILVHVDALPAASRRLDLALMLAERTEAHIVGLYVDSFEQMLLYSDVYAVASLLDIVAEEAARTAEAARARFDQAVAGRAVTTEWRAVKGLTDRKIAEHARYADLTVLGQNDPDNLASGSAARAAEHVPLISGKPCLIVPHADGPVGFGENILIAWNGSREALRAVHDALPLLKSASKVVIFSFSSRKDAGLRGSAEMLADHLSRHEVDSLISDWTNTGDMSAVEALFASLDTQDSDLLVAGAFGHSRTFEALFGGVSLELLRQPTLPILMSH